MATAELTSTPLRADRQASQLDALDAAAHAAASHVRTTPPAPKPSRTVLERFPAGGPRGQWPAEGYAAEQRRNGVPARVVMDLATDSFLVIVEVAS
ncbi:hypothetical protein ACJ6WE_09095 [Streptomyces sp. MMS24-I31]|uniref:hypothetical protein n=1 Tax=Streptomyces sp. MMS24-I31 TaxID=3351563 RepID=UPI003896E514